MVRDAIVSADGFESLELPHKTNADETSLEYLVYSSEKEHVRVEATNAQEAIERSGVAKPVRVIRAMALRLNVLNMPLSAPVTPAAAAVEAPVEKVEPVVEENVVAPVVEGDETPAAATDAAS